MSKSDDEKTTHIGSDSFELAATNSCVELVVERRQTRTYEDKTLATTNINNIGNLTQVEKNNAKEKIDFNATTTTTTTSTTATSTMTTTTTTTTFNYDDVGNSPPDPNITKAEIIKVLKQEFDEKCGIFTCIRQIMFILDQKYDVETLQRVMKNKDDRFFHLIKLLIMSQNCCGKYVATGHLGLQTVVNLKANRTQEFLNVKRIHDKNVSSTTTTANTTSMKSMTVKNSLVFLHRSTNQLLWFRAEITDVQSFEKLTWNNFTSKIQVSETTYEFFYTFQTKLAVSHFENYINCRFVKKLVYCSDLKSLTTVLPKHILFTMIFNFLYITNFNEFPNYRVDNVPNLISFLLKSYLFTFVTNNMNRVTDSVLHNLSTESGIAKIRKDLKRSPNNAKVIVSSRFRDSELMGNPINSGCNTTSDIAISLDLHSDVADEHEQRKQEIKHITQETNASIETNKKRYCEENNLFYATETTIYNEGKTESFENTTSIFNVDLAQQLNEYTTTSTAHFL